VNVIEDLRVVCTRLSLSMLTPPNPDAAFPRG
jgi:hypothetical protein